MIQTAFRKFFNVIIIDYTCGVIVPSQVGLLNGLNFYELFTLSLCGLLKGLYLLEL